jgi:hypothetical protein
MLDENEKNIEDGEFVTDAATIEKMQKNLRSFGGSGKVGNKNIYRQVLGKVVPLGVGLTLNPAADVQGVAVQAEEIDTKTEENTSSITIVEENNTSQDDKINVKKERIYMKITKIEDITDTLLKEVTASSITEFIGEEIKKLNDQFAAEKAEKETALKAATEKSETALAEQETLKKQLAEVSEKLSAIEAQQLAKAQEEAFNMRMADLDNEYDLSDEDRKVLASDIKDLNEEGFSAYKGKMAVLMKEKNKAAKKAQMKKEEEMKAAVASQEVKASEEVAQTISTTQEVVEQAVDNGSKASTEIPNSAPATEQTVREKYASAFGLEGFSITNK